MRLAFFLLILFPIIASGQSDDVNQGKAHFASHPKILFDESDEAALRNLIDDHPLFRKVHNVIIAESDELILEPVPTYELTGRRLLAVARESRRRIFFLSYAWRMTREARYLQRAESELLAVAGFPDWNPSHFLDAAELTMASAIGLDWLYDELSIASREAITQAIIEKGLLPSLSPKYNKWLTYANNWNQVCNAGMVFGALAVKDRIPDLAMNIIRRAVKSVTLAMQQYEPDGGYPEGYGYWSYGTTFNVLMITALEKNAGAGIVPLNRGFLKSGYYLRHMAGPSGQNFNYSDNHPVMPLNPAMFWFAQKNDDPALLHNELAILERSKHLHRVRELPALLIWGADVRWSDINVPRDLIWVGQGKNAVATLRSGWSEESLFIGLKAGSPSYAHGHMDIGSFVFDALGERWVSDLPPQNYHSLEKEGLQIWRTRQNDDRWRVFRLSNRSHNTIMINDQPLKVDEEARVEMVSDRDEFLSCVTDLTSMYRTPVRMVKRGVAIAGGTEAFIQDEVILDQVGSLNWKMLTSADVEIVDARNAILRLNGKQIRVVFDLPPGVAIRKWSADPPAAYDEANPGYRFIGFDATLSAGRRYTFRATLKTGAGSNEKAIVPIEQWPY